MLELLLSLDHETSKLFDWLESYEILELTCVNRALHQACERYCQNEGVPRLVAIKRAEISRICDSLEDRRNKDGAHPFHAPWVRNPSLKIEVASIYESYQGFLEAILRTPLSDTVVNLPSWSKRYWKVSQPRPRAIRRQGFDYGYRRTGYWCDAFGCGAPNDYFRLVGNDPNRYWSLCLAGSNMHHIRWRDASNKDRRSDLIPLESSKICYIQRSYRPTEWDKTRQYWRDCRARFRQSK